MRSAGLLALILVLPGARAYAQSVPSATPVPSASPVPAPNPVPLTATPAQLDVRAGTSSSVQISGASGALSATLQPKIASLAVDPASHTIVVTPQIPFGRSLLHVSDASGASVDVVVRIAQNAGTIPKNLLLRVTGDALDPLWLRSQITQRVNRATLLQAGAQAHLGDFTPPVLPAGASASVAVPVTLAGSDERYFTVTDTANVMLEHVPASPFSPALLYYDDDPEQLADDGVLYRGTVSASAPVRLYYYHENGRDPRQLIVMLSAAQAPSSVQIIDSTAGPNADVLTVGHNATRNFLQLKPANQGTVIDVAPDEPFSLQAIPMGSFELVAGVVDLRVRDGGPVTIVVLAAPSGATPTQIALLSTQAQVPGDGHKRTGAFALTSDYTVQTLSYTVGGPDASALYGATSPPPAGGGQLGKDYGDYGVLRTLNFEAANPAGSPATVYLYEKPQGGVVRSSFLVNGVLHEVGCARVAHAYLIAPLTLAPGGHATFSVTTMTDGGSSYPLEVGMTATPPESAVPPIFSADGCFPKPGF